MGIVLDKKYSKKDSVLDIVKAIEKLAKDKFRRVVLVDDVEWKQTKLTEIARLARILKNKIKNDK